MGSPHPLLRVLTQPGLGRHHNHNPRGLEGGHQDANTGNEPAVLCPVVCLKCQYWGRGQRSACDTAGKDRAGRCLATSALKLQALLDKDMKTSSPPPSTPALVGLPAPSFHDTLQFRYLTDSRGKESKMHEGRSEN